MSETPHCRIEGCKRPYRAKGYCNVHFREWRRGELEKKPRYKTCTQENCRKPMTKFGFCEEHYSAWAASRKGVQPQAGAPVAPAEASSEAAPKAEEKP